MTKSTKGLDGLMIMIFVAATLMSGDTDPNPGVVFAGAPWMKWSIVFGLALVAALIVAFLSKLDRRRHDEFVFAIMTNAALIAVTTTLLIQLVWIFLGDVLGLPQLSSVNMAGILMMSWAFGYGWFRLRGFGG